MTIELTGNETLDELEAMLDKFDDADVIDGSDNAAQMQVPADSQSTEQVPVTSEGDTNVVPPATDGIDTAQSEDQQEKKVIVAKDGVHTIPYDVLEAERREAERLRQQISDMQQKQTGYEQQSRLLELRDKQLQKLGIDPDDLPENLKVSDQQLEELRENYPEVAPFIAALMAKVDSFSAQSAPVTAAASNPVLDEIKLNTDLNSWMEEKGDKWSLSLDIDDRLMADPEWSQKPQRERFQEVVRRTKAAFGETVSAPVDNTQVRESAVEKEKAAAESLPASPSLVGASNTHQSSVLQQAATMGNADLQNLMAGMTADQIDALLEQADF